MESKDKGWPKFPSEEIEDDVNNFYDLVDSMAEDIPVERPWEAPNAIELDQVTFQDFIDENCKTEYVHHWHSISAPKSA